MKEKKVLILAYDFPPYVSVGGLRPYNWFKYFREFGVEPIVITRQWENKHGNGLDYISASRTDCLKIEKTEYGTIYRTPYQPTMSNLLLIKFGDKRFKFLRKFITAFYEIFQFLFFVGSKKQIYQEAKKFLNENEIDVIIASGDPFVLFHYANKLSNEFKIPWVADYRDPWSQNISLSNTPFYRWISSRFETKIIKNASAVTTVSEFLKIKIGEINFSKKIFVLPNGFDEMLFQKIKNQNNTNCLKIKFAGTIYPWHPWKNVLDQLSLWKESRNCDFELNFIGVNIQLEVENYIENHLQGLRENIVFTPKIQNEILVTHLADANLLLLFNDYSILGTKIFDYLGVQRKILMCYGNDSKALKLKTQFYKIEEVKSVSNQLQTDLIQETNSGIVVENESQLISKLNELYAEFQKTGKIDCNSVNVENYSRKIQVKNLADIIKTL